MGKKRGGPPWSRLFLFLLITVGVVVFSWVCVQCVEEEWSDDDLEDWEEGMGGERERERQEVEHVTAVSKVANVKEEDVDGVVAKFDYVLMLGYAPWDTQSQALLGEFAAAAVELSRQGNPTVLAKLDAVHNAAAASRYQIRGFPTLLFFTNTTLRQQYSGGYSREEIVLWVRKKTGFAVTTLTSTEEAEFFLRKKGTATLGYFDKLEGPDYDAFLVAAQAATDTEFVLTTVPEVAQMFISPPFIALRKQEPERFSVFGGSFNAKEITAFVDLNKHPLLAVLNTKNANTVYSSPLKLHILLFAESKDYEGVKSLYLEAAKQFKGKDEGFSRPMLSVYGLDTGKPVVAGLNNEDGSRYLLESDLTYENLKEFAAGLYSGTLPVYYKSQRVPTENDDLVKMVVGKTVDEIVMDEMKDVFLFVHAPWCSSCEKVGRVFEKLAKHVQEVPSLLMAKYDAQENEHPLLMDVPNYPSLFLYPAGRKSSKPMVAKSQTSWKKLSVFLKENVAIPFPVVAKEDSPRVVNSEVGSAATEELPEIIDTPSSLDVDVVALASETQQQRDLALFTEQSQLQDEL